MKILAVDTSTMISSVAVLEDDHIIGDFSISQSKTHSEQLLPMIGDMLDRLGMKLSDIDVFSVAIGPGSFTGLRIGVSVVKTMAQVLNKPIIGISTLEAMAHGIYSSDVIVPIIDARGNRIFVGEFVRYEGKFIKISEERLTTVDEFILNMNEKSYLFVGDGAKKLDSGFNYIIPKHHFTLADMNNCIARSVAVLAKKRYENGDFDSFFDLVPNYLRKSQAEIDNENKN